MTALVQEAIAAAQRPPTVHVLKTQQPYFDEVCAGRKGFEVRKDDRAPRFESGDLLVLREWSTGSGYSGAQHIVKVGFVLRDATMMPHGWVAFDVLSVTEREADIATIAAGTELSR